MAKTMKRLLCAVLTLAMCMSMLCVPAMAAEEPIELPEVTVALTPGKVEGEAVTETKDLDDGTLSRTVTTNTSEITTTTKQTAGELTAVQSALKFDRNDTADQKAQKVARELYTDTGHFTDPSTVTVSGAPTGYPFKYVGHGDYSGHYVSHVRVIYARDAAGNAIVDENGNYVIDHLEHASSGTPLHYAGELVKNIDGPYHYATGTRSQQFLLMDEAGATYYGYCIDLATGAESNTWYALANLEDNDYYASEDAENHVRGIVFNGYWGAESGTGSLASLKEVLKAAVAAGSVEDEYTIKQVNRKKFTTGYELQEGEYHYGSYVYWDIPAKDVKLTAEIIDQMTEGEALDAMQAAIWSWANGSQATLNGVDGVVVGDMSAASSAMSDSLNGKNDPEGAARTRALYAWLMQQEANADADKTVIVNDKTFVEDISLTIGKQLSATEFEAALKFSNSFTVDQKKDNLKIVLTYVDADGVTQTIEKTLVGKDALVADENGYYTINGLKLSKANPFQFTLNIVGEQYLTKNAYIFTSEKGVNGSQTFVSLAEGNISVDVSKSVEVTFDVKNGFEPNTPPEHVPETPVPTADKKDKLTDRDTNRFEVEIAVPGEDGTEKHDEVILMVDGSYSMDNEWPAMKEAINTIGETVLNGSGNTQLTLMAFGMGDNEVLVHIKDAKELAAALGELPGNLLYGRSSTNCEAGFTGVAKYIANHDDTLNEVQVIFISDGNINTDESLSEFYDWQNNGWHRYSVQQIVEGAFALECAFISDAGLNASNAYKTVFGDANAADMITWDAQKEPYFKAGSATLEQLVAWADQVWADVYAYSGLIPYVEYPVSVVERAFAKYDDEHNTHIQDAFYYALIGRSYPDRGTRTPAAADALAAMDEVAAMYVVDYDSKTAWMDTGITSEKSTFIKSDGIAGLCEALQGALTNLAKTPFNDVYVTDYMSKWVNLDQSTLKIVDNSTGEVIWTVADGWKVENAPTAKNPPVVVERVDPADYAAGGDDVIGNNSGDIYKLTWYVKDGAMLRSDTYSLKYDVTVDTEEKDFEFNKEYPANGNTDLHYTDENGKEQTKEIKVPPVDAIIVPEIIINKVDTNGNGLTGAKFALYFVDDAGEKLVGEFAVDSEGKIAVKNLKPGVYKLVETVAPNGYIGAEPMYFKVGVDENNEGFEIKHYFDEFEVEFPATAYEISNHAMSPAIPQTFVLLEGDKADNWSYPGEYVFGESNYRVVYCGDSNTGLEDGTRYVKTNLEDCFDAATSNKLRVIVANSYPYVSMEDMIAAADEAGVADAANLTRGDIIAAVQMAIWRYTNGVEDYTYKATYSVKDYPQWGKVYHDYSAELPEGLPNVGSTAKVQDAAGEARIRALYNYLVNLDGESAKTSEVDVFFYTAVGGKSVSQSLIGADKPGFYTDGLEIYVKNVEIPEPPAPPAPPAPPTVSFKSGEASNISFMLIDPATGEVEFLEKIDIGNETSFEIPTEDGKISAVFIKQSTSGMFWISEEVSEEIVNKVIECLKDNNPSYKGHNAVAFGNGDHELEFKKNKFATYTFEGAVAIANDEVVSKNATSNAVVEEKAEATVTEPTVNETEIPVEDHGKTHLLGDAEGDLATFNFKVVPEYKPAVGEERYAVVGSGEQTEFWTAYMFNDPATEGETAIMVGDRALYSRGDGRAINGIYLNGEFHAASDLEYPGKAEGKNLQAAYNGLQQALLMNGNGKKVAVYCADHVTPTTTAARYNVVNIEDAEHYDEDTASKIRAIAVNGYWGGTETVDQYGTLAKMKAMMRASGKFTEAEIALLSPGVALSATQFAIWELANENDDRQVVNVQYIVKNRVAGYNGKTWNTLKITPAEEDACVDLIFKLSHYLTTLKPIPASAMSTANTVLNYNNILQDVEIEVVKKAAGHANNADDNKDNDAYVTNVTFDILKVSEKDKLVAKVVDAEGNVYAIGRIAGDLKDGEVELVKNSNGTYTFTGITLIENAETTYTVVVEGVQYLERNVYLYFAGERETSQTLIGYDEGEFSVDVESSIKETFNVDEPETPPTVSFNSGDASNISFMLIDAEGNVEFVKKYDIGGETSFEIPTEEGKISAVFVKQSTSGMFWISQEVDEAVVDAVIECLKANNPSYKGYNAVAFGAGNHDLEFKEGKFVTYTFTGEFFSVNVEVAEESVVEETVTEETVVEETVTEETVVEETVTEETVTEETVVEETVTEETVVEETVIDETVADEPVVEDEPTLDVDVDGADVESWTIVDDVTAIYIAANGKVPAVIWTSEEVDEDTLAALIDELGADADAKYVFGFDSHEIEYQHNKNKTKTVTYTFG